MRCRALPLPKSNAAEGAKVKDRWALLAILSSRAPILATASPYRSRLTETTAPTSLCNNMVQQGTSMNRCAATSRTPTANKPPTGQACSGFELLNQVPKRFVPLDTEQNLWGQAFDNLDHLLMPPPLPRPGAGQPCKTMLPTAWVNQRGTRIPARRARALKAKCRVRSPVPPNAAHFKPGISTHINPQQFRVHTHRARTAINTPTPCSSGQRLQRRFIETSTTATPFSSQRISPTTALLSPENTAATSTALPPRTQLFTDTLDMDLVEANEAIVGYSSVPLQPEVTKVTQLSPIALKIQIKHPTLRDITANIANSPRSGFHQNHFHHPKITAASPSVSPESSSPR